MHAFLPQTASALQQMRSTDPYQGLAGLQEEVEPFVNALLPGNVQLDAAASHVLPEALAALKAGKHVFMEVGIVG